MGADSGAGKELLSPILLWLAGLNSFQANAQPQPPHGELRQSPRSDGCKRRPIVGTNSSGQAELREG
jgi:hypothetical protein